MKYIAQYILLTLGFLFIGIKIEVFAVDPPLSGDYTMTENVVFPSLIDQDNPSRVIIGLDAGTGGRNEAKLTIENGASLNLTSEKTFAVGGIQLNNGSIFIANGASIRIGTAIFAEDTDNDHLMGSASGKIVSGSTIIEPAGTVRRNTITSMTLDCNDADSNYTYTTTGNPPVAHWRLDDATTATTIDNAGALNGTATGTTVVTSGKYGRARFFNGSSDTIAIPNDATLNFAGSDTFTIEAWVKTTASDLQQTIFSKMYGSGKYRGYELNLLSTGQVRLLLVNDASNNRLDVVTTETVNDGAWHHIAVAYDGSYRSSGVSIYRDGQKTKTSAQNNSLTGTIASSALPSIGSRYGNYFMSGYLDDIRIYNYVRSETQILEDINNYSPVITQYAGDTDADGYGTGSAITNCKPLSGYGPKSGDCASSDATYGKPTTGNPPIAYWKMDETSGKTVKDTVGAHDGIALNTTITTGVKGNARDFSGLTNYILVPKDESDFDFTATSKLTISAWIKTGAGSGLNEIVSKLENRVPNRGWKFWHDQTNLGFDFANDYTNGSDVIRIFSTPSASLTDNNWHHVAVTYPGSAKNAKIYMDGKEIQTEVKWDHLVSPVINNEPVRIGYGSTSYTVMDGQIDEVRIYNYDRTADQISQDYGFSMPTYTQFPEDTDGDGYGTNGISDVSCAPLANYGVKSNDCDDSTSGSGAYSTTITGSAPIASWSFDETSGTLVKEDIAAQNGLAANTTIVDGMFGKARNFNGTSSYVTIPSVIRALPVTISTWVYLPATPSGWVRILRSDLGNSNHSGVTFSLTATAAADITFGDNTGATIANRRSLTSANGIPIGQWTHLAATINGATDMHIYINGAEAGGSYSGTGGSMVTTNNYGLIGANDPYSLFFPGYIDSLRIYNYIRTQAQLQEDMRNAFPTFTQYQTDADKDGFSATNNSISTCFPVVGYGPVRNDCDDSDPLQRPIITGNNPVAYWKLNEPYATNDVDIINGNILKPTGTPTPATGISAYYGLLNARSFDGSNNLRALSHSSLQRSGSWSISAWMYPTNITNGAAIVGKNSEYLLQIDNTIQGNKVACYMYVDGSWRNVKSSDVPTLNVWTHVECTYDGTVLRLYINGGTPTTSNYSGTSTPTINVLDIGQINDTYRFVGYIDDVRLYNYARSATQVLEDKNMYMPKVSGYTDNDSDSYGVGSSLSTCSMFRAYNNTDTNDNDATIQN